MSVSWHKWKKYGRCSNKGRALKLFFCWRAKRGNNSNMEFVQGREAKSPQRKKTLLWIFVHVLSLFQSLSSSLQIPTWGDHWVLKAQVLEVNTFVALAYVERRLDSKKPVYVCLILGEVWGALFCRELIKSRTHLLGACWRWCLQRKTSSNSFLFKQRSTHHVVQAAVCSNVY